METFLILTVLIEEVRQMQGGSKDNNNNNNSSFTDFKNKISTYFRTKIFNLDMRNYLVRDV